MASTGANGARDTNRSRLGGTSRRLYMDHARENKVSLHLVATDDANSFMEGPAILRPYDRSNDRLPIPL